MDTLLPWQAIWPMAQFEKDFEVLGKVGEGQYGKVYSVRSRRPDGCPRRAEGGQASPALPHGVQGPAMGDRLVDPEVQTETGIPGEDALYAAKFLHCKGAAVRLRVRDEIDILRSLDHPNIIRLITAYEDLGGENVVQVLEYLGGGELYQRIIDHDGDSSLSEVEIRSYVEQICQGCAYLACNKVVHLDLKPENILCGEKRGHRVRVKLVDFGFARRLQEGQDVRVMQGTPEFVSPEVISYEPISLNTDMWSVGVLTYVLLTGLSPFGGKDNQETFDNVLNCRYTFDEEEFSLVSDEAKDFIAKLLVVDQGIRLTASESLQQPWMLPRGAGKLWCVDLRVRERLKGTMARLRWLRCKNVLMLACNGFLKGNRSTD